MSEAIFGKYQLIARLGHGGMAEVYLGVTTGIGGFKKLSVVKTPKDEFADDPEFVAMLMDEARLAARLNHSNVVQTYEVGEANGKYYFAMEFLDGQPLHRILAFAQRRNEPFFPELQYLILCDVLKGLHHAHEIKDFEGRSLGVVHRDVTPPNIFVTYEGQVKVVDFGVAKAQNRLAVTQEGVMKGKVRYMAPEQALGSNVDRRADIFSVGVMVWEAATGERFWPKDLNDIAILRRLLSGNFDGSAKRVKPEVPDAIEKICLKALSPDLNDRYETALDMQVELEQYLTESQQLMGARKLLGPTVAKLFLSVQRELSELVDSQLALLAKADAELKMVQISADDLAKAKSIQGTGKSIQGTGKSIQGTGKSIQGTGKSIQGTGKSIQGTGKSIQGTGKSIQGTGKSIQGAGRSVTPAGSIQSLSTNSEVSEGGGRRSRKSMRVPDVNAQGIKDDSLVPTSRRLLTINPPPPPLLPRERVPLYAGGLILCGLLSVGIALSARFSGRNSGTAEGARQIQGIVGANMPAPKSVRVQVRALPADARITIDGAPVTNPFDTSIVPTSVGHLVRIESTGHTPHMEVVKFDSNVELSIVLQEGNSNVPEGQKPLAGMTRAPVRSATTVILPPLAPPPLVQPPQLYPRLRPIDTEYPEGPKK